MEHGGGLYTRTEEGCVMVHGVMHAVMHAVCAQDCDIPRRQRHDAIRGFRLTAGVRLAGALWRVVTGQDRTGQDRTGEREKQEQRRKEEKI